MQHAAALTRFRPISFGIVRVCMISQCTLQIVANCTIFLHIKLNFKRIKKRKKPLSLIESQQFCLNASILFHLFIGTISSKLSNISMNLLVFVLF